MPEILKAIDRDGCISDATAAEFLTWPDLTSNLGPKDGKYDTNMPATIFNSEARTACRDADAKKKADEAAAKATRAAELQQQREERESKARATAVAKIRQSGAELDGGTLDVVAAERAAKDLTNPDKRIRAEAKARSWKATDASA